MSWISDVKHDIGKLDVSIKSLRKFGFTVGTVFLLLSLWFIYREIYHVFRLILLVPGIILIITAFISPGILKSVYKVWMGIAFVLGWLVSRIILTILFFFVLLPVGLIAKIFKKDFLDISMNKKSASYWVKKETTKINYEKMF